jgi:hypothetical protein
MTSFFRSLPAWQPEPIAVYNQHEVPIELHLPPIVEYHFQNRVYQYTFITRGMVDAGEWDDHVKALLMHRAWHVPDEDIDLVDWVDWAWQVLFFMHKWGREGVPPDIRLMMETLCESYSGYNFEQLVVLRARVVRQDIL